MGEKFSRLKIFNQMIFNRMTPRKYQLHLLRYFGKTVRPYVYVENYGLTINLGPCFEVGLKRNFIRFQLKRKQASLTLWAML